LKAALSIDISCYDCEDCVFVKRRKRFLELPNHMSDKLEEIDRLANLLTSQRSKMRGQLRQPRSQSILIWDLPSKESPMLFYTWKERAKH
jgi:hypothetical protein